MKLNQSGTPIVAAVALGLSIGCGSATASSGFEDPATGNDSGISAVDAASPEDAGVVEGSATTTSTTTTTSGDTDAGKTGTSTSTGTTATQTSRDASAPTNNALHVEGNHLVYQGTPTRLLGVNHSGTEYTCLSSGIFEGPDPDTLATGILSWGPINAVRVPLNEDCWLGINGVNAQYSGETYQTAIVAYVAKLHTHGLFAVVDLHWSAPGSFLANAQQPMADADHAVDFWTSVATALKGDPMTIFDLYNEPFLTTSNAETSDPWQCWLDGCTVTQGQGGVTGNWQSAGMQALLGAVRATGATNVVMVGGLNYADDLTEWLTHVPNDPLHQVTAALHAYAGGPCAVSSCWTSVLQPIAAQYPIITGELGEYDCGYSFIQSFFAWADTAGVSYIPWTWNTWDCGSGPALISDYSGTATGFGQGYEMHMQTAKP